MKKNKPKKIDFIFACLGFGFSCLGFLEEGIGTTVLIGKRVLYMIFTGKKGKNMRTKRFSEASRLVGGSSVVVM